MNKIQEEIKAIKERNKRVKRDKAWEVSWTRRGFIALITYIVASIIFILLKNNTPLLNAFIPTVGYILSTFSLPFIKTWWLKSYIKCDSRSSTYKSEVKSR